MRRHNAPNYNRTEYGNGIRILIQWNAIVYNTERYNIYMGGGGGGGGGGGHFINMPSLRLVYG